MENFVQRLQNHIHHVKKWENIRNRRNNEASPNLTFIRYIRL